MSKKPLSPKFMDVTYIIMMVFIGLFTLGMLVEAYDPNEAFGIILMGGMLAIAVHLIYGYIAIQLTTKEELVKINEILIGISNRNLPHMEADVNVIKAATVNISTLTSQAAQISKEEEQRKNI